MGFKLKIGSKEKNTDTNFRMDSPLKQTGFGAGENMRSMPMSGDANGAMMPAGDDTAMASQAAYSNPTVQGGQSLKTPLYKKKKKKSYDPHSREGYNARTGVKEKKVKKSKNKKGNDPHSPAKKYMGFDKLSSKIQKEGKSKEAADAIAASIGRKKYGKSKFQKAAAKGRKLG